MWRVLADICIGQPACLMHVPAPVWMEVLVLVHLLPPILDESSPSEPSFAQTYSNVLWHERIGFQSDVAIDKLECRLVELMSRGRRLHRMFLQPTCWCLTQGRVQPHILDVLMMLPLVPFYDPSDPVVKMESEFLRSEKSSLPSSR